MIPKHRRTWYDLPESGNTAMMTLIKRHYKCVESHESR